MAEPVVDMEFEASLDRAFDAAIPDTPEGGDAPAQASEAPPPVPESAPQIGVDRGDGPDATGKFVGKGMVGDAAPGTEQPPPPPTPEAVVPRVDGEAAKAPDPFRVRFRGAEHEVIPGAVVREDGLLIPKDHIGKAQELFGQALKFDSERMALKEQMVRARQSEAMAKANEAALNAEIARLFEIASNPNDEELAVQAVQYLLDLRQSRPILEQKLVLEREKAELALQRELAAPDPDQTREHITQQVVTTAQEHLQSFEPYLQGLTDEDAQTLLQRVLDDPERYAYRTGHRLTEREQAAGVQPGQIVFDADALYRDAQVLHQYRQKITAAEAAQRDAVKAAQQNARVAANAAPPPPTPPPAPAGRSTSTAVQHKGATWDEFKENLTFTLD